MKTKSLFTLCFILLPSSFCLPAFAQGTAFTYQGRLNDGANPANGTYNLRFALFDALTVGNQVGSPVTNAPVNVSNGLFTVALDFGANFPGANRWLEIGVRTNGGGAFTSLIPRQPLTATPYAITAGNLNGALSSTSLSGTYSSPMTLNNVANNFAGSGANLTALNASQLASGTVPAATLGNAWQIGGNAGTTPGTHFVGTTDNQPLEFKVNNQRGLRLEPTGSNDTVNVIGGSAQNYVGAGVVGATIGGGGSGNYLGGAYTNSVEADFGTVSGGLRNTIQPYATGATIGGGVINTIQFNAFYATLGGGYANMIQNSASYATLGGGYLNRIQPYTSFATIPGGRENSAANYAFAAGRRAKANHTGAFVWGDSTDADFTSTADNQFLIRAGGGVGIGKNNPATALDVNGTVTATGFSGNGSLDFTVNNQRGLRLEPTASTDTVNVIGGSTRNFVGAGVVGATIGGGGSGDYSGYAYTNRVEADFGTVSGGLRNTIQTNATYATLGGGNGNTIENSATYATLGGGNGNTIENFTSGATIGGGDLNAIDPGALDATIGGGDRNTIHPFAHYATIGGGDRNVADGEYATIPGGDRNSATFYAFAAGHRAKANHYGAFVWSDSTDADFASTAVNQFAIRASGGVVLSDSTPNLSFGNTTRQMLNLFGTDYGLGVQFDSLYFRCPDYDGNSGFSWYKGGVHNDGYAQPGAGGIELMHLIDGGLWVHGTFINSSDRNVKQDFAAVNSRAVLEKVAQLPIQIWAYKSDPHTKHLGPVAQDFYAAFAVGPDDKHITTVDESGVALAAIQGLNEKVESGKQKAEIRIEKLEAENAELKQRLEKLEQLMNRQTGGAK